MAAQTILPAHDMHASPGRQTEVWQHAEPFAAQTILPPHDIQSSPGRQTEVWQHAEPGAAQTKRPAQDNCEVPGGHCAEANEETPNEKTRPTARLRMHARLKKVGIFALALLTGVTTRHEVNRRRDWRTPPRRRDSWSGGDQWRSKHPSASAPLDRSRPRRRQQVARLRLRREVLHSGARRPTHADDSRCGWCLRHERRTR